MEMMPGIMGEMGEFIEKLKITVIRHFTPLFIVDCMDMQP
jgi:hypothetical protein